MCLGVTKKGQLREELPLFRPRGGRNRCVIRVYGM